MSEKAERLVNEAKKNNVGLPLDMPALILELMESEGLTKDQATKQIYQAVGTFRKNRPLSVGDKVRRAIIDGSGKPSKKELTFGEGDE